MDTMSRIGLKKILIFLGLLALLAGVGFTQQRVSLQIIGKIPDPRSVKVYQIQLGAFSKTHNAAEIYTQLRQAGFTPVYEQYRNLTRVLLQGISARDVKPYLERIEQAGFKEIILREEAGKKPAFSLALFNAKWEIASRDSDFVSFEFDEHGNFLAIKNANARDPAAYLGKYTVKSLDTLELEDYGVITLQDRMNNAINFTFTALESDTPAAYHAKEDTSALDNFPETDLLCRAWRAVTIGGDNVQEAGGEHLTFFSRRGAFYVVYLDEDRSALGQWKWKDHTRTEFVYSWDNWKTQGTDRIHTLADTYLKDEWAIDKYETPPVWESVPY
jgi:hypothetical protein